jgi:hypothetical protein
VTLPREAGKTRLRRCMNRHTDVGLHRRRLAARSGYPGLRESHHDGRVRVRKAFSCADRFATSSPGIVLMADHA